MSLTTILNGDTGLSARTKINTLINRSQATVNPVGDYGADNTGGVDSTTAIGNAIADAFGVCRFTASASSGNLVVSSVQQGFLQTGRIINLQAWFIAVCSGTTMYTTNVAYSIQPGATLYGTVTGATTVVSQSSGSTGGAGTYTISSSQNTGTGAGYVPVSSGTYNSTSGLVTLTLAFDPGALAYNTINVNLSGTGSIASCNGIQTVTYNKTGTIKFFINTGLTLTITSSTGNINIPVALKAHASNTSATITGQVSGTTGGAGTYTLSSALTIASGSVNIFCSNGQGSSGQKYNKTLSFPAGEYICSQTLYLINISQPVIEGNGATITFQNMFGSEGNCIAVGTNNYTPCFGVDGVNLMDLRDLTINWNASSSLPQINIQTSAASAIGLNTVTFSSTAFGVQQIDSRSGNLVANAVSLVQPGWTIMDFTNPLAISLATVTAVTPNSPSAGLTTVAFNNYVDAASNGGTQVGLGDTIMFVNSSVGLFYQESGFQNYCGANNHYNCSFAYQGMGIVAQPDAGNCENHLHHACYFSNNSYAGLRAVGYNTLNWMVWGGGANLCGTASNYDPYRWPTNFPETSGNGAAGYSIGAGAIREIHDISQDFCTWDVSNHGSPILIASTRCEGNGHTAQMATITLGNLGSGNGIDGAGNMRVASVVGTLTPGMVLDANNGSVMILSQASGTPRGAGDYVIQLGGPAQTTGTVVYAVCRVVSQCFNADGQMHISECEFGGDIGYLNGGIVAGEGMRWLDTEFGGTIQIDNTGVNVELTSDVNTLIGLGDQSFLVAENFTASGNNTIIVGGGISTIDMGSACQFNASMTNLLSSYNGHLIRWDAAYPQRIFANLPSASTGYLEGLVMTITDASAAYTAALIGTAVSGGGSHVVKVRVQSISGTPTWTYA